MAGEIIRRGKEKLKLTHVKKAEEVLEGFVEGAALTERLLKVLEMAKNVPVGKAPSFEEALYALDHQVQVIIDPEHTGLYYEGMSDQQLDKAIKEIRESAVGAVKRLLKEIEDAHARGDIPLEKGEETE